MTSHHAMVSLLPLRVHVNDKNMLTTSVDVVVNFDMEDRSFTNMAMFIVTSFTHYVPTNMYRMNGGGRTHIGDERGTR